MCDSTQCQHEEGKEECVGKDEGECCGNGCCGEEKTGSDEKTCCKEEVADQKKCCDV